MEELQPGKQVHMRTKRLYKGILLLLAIQIMLMLPVQAEGYSDYLDSIMDMAKERYYEDVSEEELIKGALKGIFDTMDDYTTFFNLDEATAFIDTLEGNYVGIGVEITQVWEEIMVTKVFASSPAEAAGILAGDKIVTVDGKEVEGITASDTASLIKGEAGTYVELGIQRGESEEIIKIRVERAVVNISPVTWRVDGDVMYIQLDSFGSNCSRYFDQALKEMDEKGIWKMVLDLRDNPGGEVFQAVSIARKLIREGTITTLDFKSEKQKDIEYLSYLSDTKYLPAVLVNENTASASEILASAIQDSRDGFLIGQKTFGKGVVQNIYPILTPEAYERYKLKFGEDIVDAYDLTNLYGVELEDSELIGWTKITTGHYLTRNGRKIHGIGLTPDYTVENYEPANGIDVQEIKYLNTSNVIEMNGIGNDVFNTEKILILEGYEINTADNILDKETCEYLKQYQAENGLKVTGVLDEATKAALNKELDNLRMMMDKQYGKARELLGLIKF